MEHIHIDVSKTYADRDSVRWENGDNTVSQMQHYPGHEAVGKFAWLTFQVITCIWFLYLFAHRLDCKSFT